MNTCTTAGAAYDLAGGAGEAAAERVVPAKSRVPDCLTTNWALVAVRVLRTTLHRVLLDPPQPTACADGVDGAVEVGVQGRTFHSLRHYYASVLIRQSESVKTVQARLGHASAAETLDPYSLRPDSDDKTREAVDAYLGPLADQHVIERA